VFLVSGFVVESYSVTVFLGRFDGVLVRPCLEQSTIAPLLAQVHTLGHEVPITTFRQTIVAKIATVKHFIVSTLLCTHHFINSLGHKTLLLFRREMIFTLDRFGRTFRQN
jgi:hypothetical protein